ncbi:MFS transporter [Azohydromonas aeria]|uniref:MFS transporter n=1 Tax=Azohydromonas aeria TaxID=2590212 RepID=UPI0012FB0422|nr:MFS transporter [Azohydromonas aeria]
MNPLLRPQQPPLPPQGFSGKPGNATPDESGVAPGDIAVGVIVGRASEYFDFFVFGLACVLAFPFVYFPFAEDRLTGTLYAFTVFALAFVVRPLGTLLGMAIQRRFGRSAKLTTAMFLLGTATAGIAFLPDFEKLGFWAVGLLVAFRCLQGIALGATWDGLPSLLAINAPAHRRGWYAMLGQLGAPLGFVVAAALFAYILNNTSPQDFADWGWRFPFYVAFAINVVATFARLRLVVTHEYESALQAHELEPAPVRELFGSGQGQGANIFVGAFAALASFALFHIVTVFPLSWIQLRTQESVGDFLNVQIIGALLAGLAMPLSGMLANRIGRRSTLGTLAVLIGLFGFAVPFLLDGGATGQYAFVLLGFVLLGLSYGQSSGSVTSNFLPHFRYTGAALTADVAWLIGAAFAPLVALGLSNRFGLIAVSFYLLSGAVCTLLALRLNKTLAAARD